jgi:hypothetical protein
MNLNSFKKAAPPQTEAAEPTSALVAAERELETAAESCSESSRHCAELDALHHEWMAQREAAFREHSANLDRHAAEKDRLARLANPAPVKAPFPVGAVLGEN